MNTITTHLAHQDEATWTPCPQCRRTLWQMDASDEFTLDPQEATCSPEVR